MRFILIALGFILFVTIPRLQATQTLQERSSDAPKLIVQIIVDHMSVDYLYRYKDNFSEGGFKRFMEQGTYLRNAYHPYPVDQYATAYVSLSTGTIPAIHGIIGDTWYARLQETILNATHDKNYSAVGGSFGTGQYAPTQLIFPSFADQLKLHSFNRSRSYAVSLYPDAAILTSGITADGAFWYDKNRGNWVTSSYYSKELPDFVEIFNRKRIPDIYLEKEWYTFYAPGDYRSSLPDNSPYEKGLDKQNTFPYRLSRLQRQYGYGLLQMIPYGNAFTKEFAASLVYDEQLGRRGVTDYLSVVFSANRSLEQRFGPHALEMQDAWVRLDEEIRHFMEFLENRFGKEHILVTLASGSGTAPHISYLQDHKIPAGYVNTRAALSLLRSYLNILYGQNNWVPFYHQKQFYLNHKAIEDQGISFQEIQHKAADFLVQITGVADVIVAESLKSGSFYGTHYAPYQNNFYPTRSGDLTLVFEPNWCERVGTEELYDYEHRTPLFLYGWKVPSMQLEREIPVIDLVPTLYRMLNMPVPNGVQGNIIHELF